MEFSAAKNENRHLEDLPQAAVGCVPVSDVRTFLVGKE